MCPKRLITVAVVVLLHSTLFAQLREYRSYNYDVFTDLPVRQAKELSSYMDGVYGEYARRFSGFGVTRAERVRLYLFDRRETYIAFMGEQGIDAANSGGMFFVINGDAGLATFVTDQQPAQMLHTLQHEGLHQFMYQRVGSGLPIWANEGLAEYFGSAIPVRGRLRLGQFSQQSVDAIRDVVSSGDWIRFEEMLELTNQEWSRRLAGGDNRTGVMYLQAWSMAHFLVHGADGQYSPMFERFLHEIKNGLGPKDAFVRAFGTDDFARFEQAWVSFVLENLEPDPISTAAERVEFMAAGLEALHEQGVAPETVNELRAELIDRGFRIVTGTHGAIRVLLAEDQTMYQPPVPARQRRHPPTVELIASRSERLPPGIEVRGLEVDLVLRWRLDGDRLVHDIVYK